MESPFPGMDPYLENPARWRGFHARFIAAIYDRLNATLPGNFVARLEERCYIVPSGRETFPDVFVARERFIPPTNGNVAVLERGSPTGTVKVEPLEIGETFIEILSMDEAERVVCVIELLSPTNKGLSPEGGKSYREKQATLRQSNVHFLEIDLLRGGEHSVAVPVSYLAIYPKWDYITCLHRAGTYKYDFWLSTVREPLPDVRVPLIEGYPDILLPLQELFAEVYRVGRFHFTDYTKDPIPPLSAEDAAWANTLLIEKDKRPAPARE